jgi:hypothetical protein
MELPGVPESGIINGATKGLMDCCASSNYGLYTLSTKKKQPTLKKLIETSQPLGLLDQNTLQDTKTTYRDMRITQQGATE